jgi:hypothetical protein
MVRLLEAYVIEKAGRARSHVRRLFTTESTGKRKQNVRGGEIFEPRLASQERTRN